MGQVFIIPIIIIFEKRDTTFLSVKSVSNLYCHPECTIYRAPWRRFRYEEGLTQHRMNGCLSASDNMSLNWNLKRSVKNGSIKIYKAFYNYNQEKMSFSS